MNNIAQPEDMLKCIDCKTIYDPLLNERCPCCGNNQQFLNSVIEGLDDESNFIGEDDDH